MLIAPDEEKMGEASPREEHIKMSDLEIDAKYESGGTMAGFATVKSFID